MDVQAGPRIGHVLLPHIIKDGILFFRLPGSPHLFQHLFDLVRFCHYNPFYFENINTEGTNITLSIAMANHAEKLHEVGFIDMLFICQLSSSLIVAPKQLSLFSSKWYSVHILKS